MITIKRVNEPAELEGIKKLQQENLKSTLTAEETSQEGFVTAVYSLEFLQKMHDAEPSVIAKDGEQVVGYALVADPSIRHEHDLLSDLFTAIDNSTYLGKQLKESAYVVVGQLCVSKSYRGQGLVNSMYNYYKDCLSGRFEYCVTDIAQDNPRSLKAHQKAGFEVINTLGYGGIKWDVVLWAWRR